MFDIFKNEAGDWGKKQVIQCDGFSVDFIQFGYHVEVSFRDKEQFGFIVWRTDCDICNYWTDSVSPPRSSCSYSEFFDWMLENKPNVAEWLLFNAI